MSLLAFYDTQPVSPGSTRIEFFKQCCAGAVCLDTTNLIQSAELPTSHDVKQVVIVGVILSAESPTLLYDAYLEIETARRAAVQVGVETLQTSGLVGSHPFIYQHGAGIWASVSWVRGCILHPNEPAQKLRLILIADAIANDPNAPMLPVDDPRHSLWGWAGTFGERATLPLPGLHQAQGLPKSGKPKREPLDLLADLYVAMGKSIGLDDPRTAVDPTKALAALEKLEEDLEP